MKYHQQLSIADFFFVRRSICRLLVVVVFAVSCLLIMQQPAAVDCQGLEVLPVPPKIVTWDTRDQVTTLLNKPYSPATYASMSSYIYQLYGEKAIIDVESKQACRLNGNMCRDNSQCCSKFCRCTKWGTMGRETCWRKCL
jgi:hypothetical protein